jgi:hypothetical protein
MQLFTDHVQDQYGNAISGASVLISQDGSPATIYSDNGVTPKANPLTTGSNGEYSFYAAGGTYIPTVTTSAGSLVSHAVTLFDPEDLAADTGSALVGYGDTTVADHLTAISLADYTALRAYAGLAKSAYVTGYLVSVAPSGIAGYFTRDDSDTTSADNGGTVIVDALGRRWKRQYDGEMSVKWFGAVGDGETHPLSEYFGTLAAAQAIYPHALALTDEIDGIAIQAALNTGRWCLVPRGRYRTTYELVYVSGSGLIGESSFFWQYNSNSPAVNAASTIYYDGSAGANTCVVRMSRVAVGTLPVHQSDESETLRNACIRGILIDGNNKAEFGLYSARAGVGNIYDKVVVTGTKKRAFFFGEFWTCEVGSLLAIHNYGSGYSIGEDLFSWATNNIVNATHWGTLLAFKNGRDAAYNEVSAPRDGVGFVVKCNRANTFECVVAELNYGAGAYVSPRTGPNLFKAVYLEDNCHFDPATDAASATNTAYALGTATQPWGIVGYNRKTDGDTLQTIFEGIFGAAPGSRYQHIKLTGDTSGGLVQEPTEPWLFQGLYGIKEIDAGFYGYELDLVQSALIDSSSGNFDIVRCLPAEGTPESVTGSVTTLYVDNTASGDKSGRDTSNYMLLADAIECARICKGVTTIDVSSMTLTSATGATLDGRGFTRRLAIEGGTTGRFNNSSGIAATVKNWRARLRIAGMAVLDRMFYVDSHVELDDNPIMRMGPDSTTGAAIDADNSRIQINGTSVLSLSASSAATKIGLSVKGNSEVSFNNAAAGTIASYTAGNAIHFDEGGGIVRVSLTTATATWAAAANVARNTGGGGGMVMAPDGLNP